MLVAPGLADWVSSRHAAQQLQMTADLCPTHSLSLVACLLDLS